MTLHAKMAMPDLQRYPLKLCLIKYELDIQVYNLENLLSAGVTNQVFAKGRNELTSDEKAILDQLASLGYEKYLNFKKLKIMFKL